MMVEKIWKWQKRITNSKQINVKDRSETQTLAQSRKWCHQKQVTSEVRTKGSYPQIYTAEIYITNQTSLWTNLSKFKAETII
jgi:hypothetical protein